MTDAATELQLQPSHSSDRDQREITDILDVSMMFAQMDYLRDSDMLLQYLPLFMAQGFNVPTCAEVASEGACTESTDSLDEVVTWRDNPDVNRIAGRPVRLRFIVRDADLFSLRFFSDR